MDLSTMGGTTAPTFGDSRWIAGITSQGPPSKQAFLSSQEPSYRGKYRPTTSYEPVSPQLRASNSTCHSPPGYHKAHRRDSIKNSPQRKRDEFDGPHQLLDPPSSRTIAAQERELLHLPTNLGVQQQDEIMSTVNDILSQCAFDFVAKYQFPIPFEPDKCPVQGPSDREWTEWAHLLQRLATKRRIPARVLYDNQIKQLVTVLENSLEVRHAANQNRPLKDDRNILQHISAATQVAKILKDATAMDQLDQLYVMTQEDIQRSKENRGGFTSNENRLTPWAILN
jgi:hypothetical protein